MSLEEKFEEVKKFINQGEWFTKNILLNKMKGTSFRKVHGRNLSSILRVLYETDFLERKSANELYFKGIKMDCRVAYRLKIV